MTPAELDASWDDFVSEPGEQPPPNAVRHFDWLRAMTAAVAAGATKADVLGMAMVFTTGGFDYPTGRQVQPKAPAYLATVTAHSESTWKRTLKLLREQGWLTPYGDKRQGPRPTPLYLLTIPTGQN